MAMLEPYRPSKVPCGTYSSLRLNLKDGKGAVPMNDFREFWVLRSMGSELKLPQ